MPKNSKEEKKKRNKCFQDCAEVRRNERLRRQRCQDAGQLAWLKPECYELTNTIAHLRARLDGLSPGQYIRNGLDHLQRIWERLQRSVGINWARIQSTAAQYKLNIYGLAQLTQFFADLHDGKFKEHLPSTDILLKVLVTISVIMSLYFIVDSNSHLDELVQTQKKIGAWGQNVDTWSKSTRSWSDTDAWKLQGRELADLGGDLRAETNSATHKGMVATWLAVANIITALISGTILTYQTIEKKVQIPASPS